MFGRKTLDLNDVILRTIRAVNPSNNTNPTANYVLTADGQGNATWQAQQGGGTGSGSTGPTGAGFSGTGITGSTGSTGRTGSTGFTGSTGPTGSTGSTGSTGPTGTIGQSFLTYITDGPTINSPTSITIIPYITGSVYSVEQFLGPCYFQFTIPVFSIDDYASTSIGIRNLYGTFIVQLGFQNAGTPLFTINGSGSYPYNNNDLIGIKYDGIAYYVYQNGIQVRTGAAVSTDPIGFVLSYLMTIVAPSYTFNNIKGYPIGSIGATGPAGNGTGPGSNLVTTNFMVASGENPSLGINQQLLYSYDGITWNGSDASNNSIAYNAIAWNGSIWVAGTSDASQSILYSSNGIHWIADASSINLFGVNGSCNTVAYNGSLWVAGGYYDAGADNLAYSYDGIQWTLSSSNMFGAQGACNSVAWNGSLWVAGGISFVSSYAKSLIYSSDGINWSESSSGNTLFSGGGCNTVAWNGSLWLAGGDNTAGGRVVYSYNGINWVTTNAGTNIFSATCASIAWNGSIWVGGGMASGNALCMGYSYNGINWSVSSSGNSLFGTGGSCTSVAWNGSSWFACGINVTNDAIYASSLDGINWTLIASAYTEGYPKYALTSRTESLPPPLAPSPTGGALVINSPTGSNGLYYSRFLNVLESTGPTGSNLTIRGDLTVIGSVSKTSGSFLIPHPNPALQDTHMLRHCFVEAPTRGDNLYRWTLTTTNRVCEQALPAYSPFLNEAWQFFVQAVDGFGQGYCVLAADEGSFRLVVSEDGTYNVLGIATRKDALARAHFDRDGVEFIAEQ